MVLQLHHTHVLPSARVDTKQHLFCPAGQLPQNDPEQQSTPSLSHINAGNIIKITRQTIIMILIFQDIIIPFTYLLLFHHTSLPIISKSIPHTNNDPNDIANRRKIKNAGLFIILSICFITIHPANRVLIVPILGLLSLHIHLWTQNLYKILRDF